MHYRAAVLVLGCLAGLSANAVNAGDIVLTLPLDCTLGQNCFVQNYMDRDEGPGAADFTCGPLSYDNHRGTDFAIPSLSAMKRGVNVQASAPGIVRSVRDNVPDIASNAPNAPDIRGRECGNGVLIEHGGGWETQYCHMKKGSVAVKPGQRVTSRTALGQVGLSGDTQFPHVHLSVRKDGEEIDPFNPESFVSCGKLPMHSLWEKDLPYIPGAIINMGFMTHVPSYADVLAGPAPVTTLAKDSPAIVLWMHAFGGEAGDMIEFRISGPDGVLTSYRSTLSKGQARYFRATGKRLTGSRWGKGTYTGIVRILRDGREISRRSATIIISE